MEERVALNVIILATIIALAALLLIWKDKGWRIGLRTLLLITTLVAALLGAIVMQARWGPD